jgi:excisionase family DNA binding protein
VATDEAAAVPEGRLAYSVAEVQGFLGIGKTLLHELLAKGQLRSIKAGRRTLIPKAALEAFLAGE